MDAPQSVASPEGTNCLRLVVGGGAPVAFRLGLGARVGAWVGRLADGARVVITMLELLRGKVRPAREEMLLD